jgi:hypothetical protein
MTTLDRLNDLYKQITEKELRHIQIIVSEVSKSLVDDLMGIPSEISFDLHNQIIDSSNRFKTKYGDEYVQVYLNNLHDVLKKDISKRIPIIQMMKCFEDAYGKHP